MIGPPITKPIIEKIITGVKENLNENGMRFESFNVEVGTDKRDFSEGKRFSKKARSWTFQMRPSAREMQRLLGRGICRPNY